MVALAGCTIHTKQQASLPPPPKPDTVKPAVEPPLSIPQTSASLNVPREWNAAAIPVEQPAEPPTPEKVETPPAAHNQHRTPGAPAKPAETQDAPSTAVPAETEEAPPAAPSVDDTAPFQPIVPVEQQNQMKGAIAARRRDIANLLTKAGEHGGNDKTLIEKIKSFLSLADDAEKRGDFAQADSLSERALALAQDLKVE